MQASSALEFEEMDSMNKDRSRDWIKPGPMVHIGAVMGDFVLCFS